MKQRVRVVVVENEKLHSELKSKVDESLKDYTFQNSTVMCVKIMCMLSVLEIYYHLYEGTHIVIYQIKYKILVTLKKKATDF